MEHTELSAFLQSVPLFRGTAQRALEAALNSPGVACKRAAAGETVTITVSRLQANNEYQEIELEVTLGKRPADLDSSAGTQAPSEEDGNMWQMPYGNR